MSETSIRFNARGEVIVPFHVVGVPEYDLVAIIEAIDKAQRARG
jgi:uncharacterized protein with GYD domain